MSMKYYSYEDIGCIFFKNGINNTSTLNEAYINTRVEVTTGRERVDNGLPCFSSLLPVPVKIRPLPVELLFRTA